jgi:hypothetical protein
MEHQEREGLAILAAQKMAHPFFSFFTGLGFSFVWRALQDLIGILVMEFELLVLKFWLWILPWLEVSMSDL